MKIFKNWFLIKRPKNSVLSKSKEYKEGKVSNMVEIYMDKRDCLKYGFEDGYVQCLKDLGINCTIDGKGKTNN